MYILVFPTIFMLKNKTDWALKVFLNTEIQLNFPEYINDVIQ